MLTWFLAELPSASQAYVSSVLDVVDAGLGDADSIAAELRQMTTILERDVNETDIASGIAVSPVHLPGPGVSFSGITGGLGTLYACAACCKPMANA